MSSLTFQQQKQSLRTEMRTRVAAMPTEKRKALSASLCDNIQRQEVWRASSTVLLFSPLKDEPDISPLLATALAEGKALALLRYDTDLGGYVPCRVRSLRDLVAGPFGILEPAPGIPVFSSKQLDIILVPGLAFDLTGRRLGRGKGYYDRLLAEVSGHKCGTCFDVQIVPSVPDETHDVRLNSILTPTRWHSCQGAV